MARLSEILIVLLYFLFSTVVFSDDGSNGELVNINAANVEVLADALNQKMGTSTPVMRNLGMEK